MKNKWSVPLITIGITAMAMFMCLFCKVQVQAAESSVSEDITLTESTAVSEVEGYSYEIIPLASPFAYYVYVKTDNPDPESFRFIDKDTASRTKSDEHEAYYVLCDGLFYDVVYENEDTYRVKGGYIFWNYYGDVDGGELVLQAKDGNGYTDTSKTVTVEKLYSQLDYLIDTYTTDDMDFFSKLSAVQAGLKSMAVYPKSLLDTDKPNESMPYPTLVYSNYKYNGLSAYYGIYEKSDKDLLLGCICPFVEDSLGFPGLLRKVAKALEPDCTVSTNSDIHYVIDVTYNGTTKHYGGAGTGTTNDIYTADVPTLFTFDFSDDDFACAGIDELRSEYLKLGSLGDDRIAYWHGIVIGDTFENAVKNGSWIRIYQNVYSYAFTRYFDDCNSHYVEYADNMWVDGRYINAWSQWYPGIQYGDDEDLNYIPVVISNVTYTDIAGAEHTEALYYEYDSDAGLWVAKGNYIRGNTKLYKNAGGTVDIIPSQFKLTKEQLKELIASNTDTIPAQGLVYDGTVMPGTAFNYDYTWSVNNGVLTISGTGDLPEFKSIYKAPWSESTFTKVVVKDGITGISSYSFYEKSDLTEIVLPECVTSIGRYAFYKCSSLKSIDIPDGATDIGEYAFCGCSSLESVKIPDSVTSIGKYAFDQCSSLKSICIPSGLTDISDWAFAACSALESVKIPDGVTDIGKDAFFKCSALTDVNFPSGLKSIGYQAFKECSSLTNLNIPSGVTDIANEAFYGCSSLEDLDIPDSVTNLSYRAFYECSGLKHVVIGDGVTSMNAFEFGFTGLESIVIGNGVTKISGFPYCTRLKSVYIPDSVTSIGDLAFFYCGSLTSLRIPSSVTSIGEDVFYGCSNDLILTVCCGVDQSVIESLTIPYVLEHSFSAYVSNGDASCTTDGTKTAKCDGCDATDTVADEGSALGHKLVKTAAKAATDTEVGNTEYYTCSRCGKYFSDAAGQIEIAKGSWIICPKGQKPMYRLYNPNSGEHLYSSLQEEVDFLTPLGWQYEGVAWVAPEESENPVYRLYNPNSGDHHYTMNKEEKDWLVGLGWTDEGIAWYSGGDVPVYRLFNPNAIMATHHYTAFSAERDWLFTIGWKDEDVAWYALSIPE